MQPKGKDRLTRPLLGGVARIENGFQRRPAPFSRQATLLDQPFQPVFEGDWFAPNEDAVAVDIKAEGSLHPSRERMASDGVLGGRRRGPSIAARSASRVAGAVTLVTRRSVSSITRSGLTATPKSRAPTSAIFVRLSERFSPLTSVAEVPMQRRSSRPARWRTRRISMATSAPWRPR